MLIKTRRYAGSFIFKLLLLMIAVSFIIWGVGDIIRNKRSIVAKVNGQSIDYSSFLDHRNRSLNEIQATYGIKFTEEQISSPEINRSILQNLIDRKLIEIEARNLGLLVSDNTVYSRISHNPAYFDSNNKFDKSIFKKILQYNNISENQYINDLKNDISTAYLMDIFSNKSFNSNIMPLIMYKYDNMSKNVAKYSINYAKLKLDNQPSDEDLMNHYAKTKNKYVVPEFRKIELMKVSVDEIKKSIKISDSEAKQEYENNLSKYSTAEKRSFYNFVFDDRDILEKHIMSCKGDDDFKKCVEKKLGSKINKFATSASYDELPEFISSPLFSMNELEMSDIFKSEYGYHVLRLLKVIPAKKREFVKIKNDIRNFLKDQKAEEKLYMVANQIEDEIASGAKISEISNRFSFNVSSLEAFDDSGRTSSNSEINLIPSVLRSEIVKSSFEMQKGDDPVLVNNGNEEYFVINLVDIVESRVKPFKEVSGDVSDSLLQELRQSKALKILSEFRDELNGKDVNEVKISDSRIEVSRINLTRHDHGNDVSKNLLSDIFSIDIGESTNVLDYGGKVSFALLIGDDSLKSPELSDLNQLNDKYYTSDDFSIEFLKGLRKKYDISIYME